MNITLRQIAYFIRPPAGAVFQPGTQRLLEERRWLAGPTLSLADFAAAAHFSCLDYIPDVDWDRSDLVRQWYATIKSRPAFRSVLADQVPGLHPAPHYAQLDF